MVLALSGMALFSLASPAEPEDPLPEDVQQFVHTEVKLVEGGDADLNADESEDEENAPAVQDRFDIVALPHDHNQARFVHTVLIPVFCLLHKHITYDFKDGNMGRGTWSKWIGCQSHVA
ncbi:hypothetical protein TCAL_16749 [Tigriopus californicus]|uniref:Uncharacterized protein n=1 Tax=Tigriopus californicus TaxID=6832 RepID=A0A553PSG6_TIGCA|nr:hypothetical protein TCAL_16749 [Tigriopus californicus]